MAQVPPPFTPTQPRSSGTRVWLWILLISVGCCVVICGVAGVFAFRAANELSSVGGCYMSYEMARTSLIAYSMEHDGKLPKADAWQDDARPYFARLYAKYMSKMKEAHMERFFGPPSPEGDWSCRWGDGKSTAMVFNDQLSGVKVKDVKYPANMVLLFESEGVGRNLHRRYDANVQGEAPRIFGQSRPFITVQVEERESPTGERRRSDEYVFEPEEALSPTGESGAGKTPKR